MSRPGAKANVATHDDWLGDESPLLPAMVQDIKRLARRARHRLGWVALLTLLLFTAPAYVIWLRNPPKIATISLSFVPRNGIGYSNREVHAYVESVLLSRQNLYGLIQRLELVAGLDRRDMDMVVDMLRDRITVEAMAQYAPEDSLGEQTPGSRIRISVAHARAAMASQLADELVAIAKQTEHERRQAEAMAQRKSVEDKRATLALQRGELTKKLIELEQQLEALNGRSLQARQVALDVIVLREQIEHIDAIGDEMLRTSFSDAYVAGLFADTAELTVLDISRPASENRSRLGLQVGISMIALMVCALVAAGCTAAFDHRIDTPADLLRLGAIGLGTWRAPPSDP